MVDTKTPATAAIDATAARYEISTGGATRAVTRYILALPELSGLLSNSAAVLHDNACGPGIVSEEVLQQNPGVEVYATDAAQDMVDSVGARLGRYGVQVALMPGEKLDFADGTFTHSITNLGLLFFKDPVAGAREIYRTLQPGGIAVISSWEYLGYLRHIIVPAQRIVRPDTAPFASPISQRWLTADGISQCLREDAGFRDVQASSYRTSHGAPSKDEFIQLGMAFKGRFWASWPEKDQHRLEAQLVEQVDQNAKDIVLPDGKPGVGVPMDAIIVFCRK